MTSPSEKKHPATIARQLLALAQTATAGPWHQNVLMVLAPDNTTIAHLGGTRYELGSFRPLPDEAVANAAFIAAANPADLALLAQAFLDTTKARDGWKVIAEGMAKTAQHFADNCEGLYRLAPNMASLRPSDAEYVPIGDETAEKLRELANQVEA